jgi:hypothetical protein
MRHDGIKKVTIFLGMATRVMAQIFSNLAQGFNDSSF